MKGNEIRNFVRCIRSDMYGFTKDEVYQVISMFYSEGESYIIKGYMFYNIRDDNEEIYMCEESCFKKSFKVI